MIVCTVLTGILEMAMLENMCPPTWKYLEHGSEHTYDHAVYQNDGEA